MKLPINGYNALVTPEDHNERSDVKMYQKYIKSIIYIMVNTQPDIAFTTSKLAQYMSEPARYYKSAVKHLLRYLHLIRNICIRYRPEDPELIRYSDADYISNRSDRKSIIGNVFMLAGGAIL